MVSASKPTCVILGAGNVAYSIVPQLIKAGVQVLQIVNRTPEHAREIAKMFHDVDVTGDWNMVMPGADLYIICTKDEAIASIADSLGYRGGLWVHTSGSVPIDTLSKISREYGVIYPMQTFTKGIEIDLKRVPFFVEGSSPETERRLLQFAERLSDNVRKADRETRTRIHAAAVFACNFVNFLWLNAQEVLAPTGTGLEILFPLIQETWDKIHKISPLEAQTGPARRDDKRVMETHLKLLSENQADIYRFLSEKIISRFNPQ